MRPIRRGRRPSRRCGRCCGRIRRCRRQDRRARRMVREQVVAVGERRADPPGVRPGRPGEPAGGHCRRPADPSGQGSPQPRPTSAAAPPTDPHDLEQSALAATPADAWNPCGSPGPAASTTRLTGSSAASQPHVAPQPPIRVTSSNPRQLQHQRMPETRADRPPRGPHLRNTSGRPQPARIEQFGRERRTPPKPNAPEPGGSGAFGRRCQCFSGPTWYSKTRPAAALMMARAPTASIQGS